MKQIKRLFMITILATVLTACGNTSTTAEEVSISLTITDQTTNTTISEDDFTVQAGTSLQTVLEENYDVEVTDDGFLTAIEGHQQNTDENIFWTYEANGEMVNEGIADYQVEDEDHITFDLQVIE
ncbi:DUF4430 domain-containing protein [Gracilibacillus thailandensis]|jgi:PBP1b-binding outer membrane lipoprotein LpoB|uniref:DUF4430 domain-containing protein n=1 Tax=Gracilibacillus thailandensis TaxID=563735 RepID=A0A6N7R5W7_9BACI|nr:DUF4430 domain-containing protein [Gracilibacillus thailandensis]MRI68663.1 DUF4430 domain-containing protein [Gracilibacillus thailandensis]